MNSLSYIIIFVLINISVGEKHEKSFNADIKLNPGCGGSTGGKNCNDTIWLAHALSKSHNSTIHYIWGTVGAPVLALATFSDVDSTLNIDWSKLQNEEDNADSVSFRYEPEDMFILALPNLILFNDTEDTGKFDDEDEHYIVPMEDFTWSLHQLTNNEVIFVTKEFRDQPLDKDQNITLKLTVYNENGRSTVLPKLLTTPQSLQFELSLENMTIDVGNSSDLSRKSTTTKPISGFQQPRWAIQMVLFSTEDPDSTFKKDSKASLDDEYSPGVFHLNDITTSDARENGEGGYLQWRPISYLSKDRDMNNSTFPNMADLISGVPNNTNTLKKSLVNAMFGSNIHDLSIASTIVSFGQPKDGFYTETEFVMWVVTMGYGTPPKETFSVVVIIVITLGVSIPTIMFLFGGIFICIRRRRRTASHDLLIEEQ